MEKTDLRKEVENVCSMLGETMINQNVEVFFHALPTIQYYPFVIKVVLKNLIENGIKYNKSNNPVIQIDYTQEGETFKLLVSDNGIGIAPKYHHKIFDMFVRLNNRNEYNGTGMGLAFCKKILTNNGGGITVESEEGKGSKFIVTLPAKIIKTDRDVCLSTTEGDEPFATTHI